MDFSQGSAVAAQFRQACSDFSFNNRSRTHSLIAVLELTAQSLAQNETIRTQAGEDPKLWPDLRKLWRDLSRMQLSFWDNDDTEDEEDEGNTKRVDEHESNLRQVCMSLAKFTRNLVAGVPANQLHAYENEPDMRSLLHFYTSWSAMENSESLATARVLTQALSNTVTANETLVARLWETYMHLPEDQVVLIRLMGCPDARTLLTTLIFILNCIHGSKKRVQLMTKSQIGVRTCIVLLDNMVRLHEAGEGSEGAKAFDVGYAIFTQFIEGGYVPDLYKRFAITNEVITPHQTTLLKLVDSYLQSTQLSSMSIQVPDILKTHENLGSFLGKRFFVLSEYAQNAMRRSLGTVAPILKDSSGGNVTSTRNSSDSEKSSNRVSSPSSSQSAINGTLHELDVMLPKVCEALVLIAQCIVTICLEAEEQQKRLENGISTFVSFTNMKGYFIMKKHSDISIVEDLIELLNLLDVFLPRINFGKPVNPDGTPMANVSPTLADGSGFSYLKRDLVRLLGVLSHGEKSVQDCVREAGGLPVVMNMCVVDERNPYLREHAIFTLSNLLKGNAENQKFVDNLKPSQEWSEDGTLKKKVGATLR